MTDELPIIIFVSHNSSGGGWEKYLTDKVWWVEGVVGTGQIFRLKSMTTGRMTSNLSVDWADGNNNSEYVVPVYKEQLVVSKMVRIWADVQRE